MLRTYGFLYTRFCEDLWFWEIAEIFRKFMFAVVSGLAIVANISELEQILVILLVVVAVALCLLSQPFKFSYHDLCEEITTLSEIVIVLCSVIVLNREGPGEFQAIEPFAMTAMSFGFFMCFMGLFIDQYRLNVASRVAKVRKRTGLSLSASVFDIEVNGNLLLRFLEKADESTVALFRKVENMIMSATLRNSQLQVENKLTTPLKAMAFHDLFFTERLLHKTDADTMTRQSARHDKALESIDDASIVIQHFVRMFDHIPQSDIDNDFPFILLFSDSINKTLPSWILHHADKAQRDILLDLKSKLAAFQLASVRREKAMCLFTARRKANWLLFSKTVNQKNRLFHRFRIRQKHGVGYSEGQTQIRLIRSPQTATADYSSRGSGSNSRSGATSPGSRTPTPGHPPKPVAQSGASSGANTPLARQNSQGTASFAAKRSTGTESPASKRALTNQKTDDRKSRKSNKVKDRFAGELWISLYLEQLLSQLSCEYAIAVPIDSSLSISKESVQTSCTSTVNFLRMNAAGIMNSGPGSLVDECVATGDIVKVLLMGSFNYEARLFQTWVPRLHRVFRRFLACDPRR
jgi:hypothetical protein